MLCVDFLQSFSRCHKLPTLLLHASCTLASLLIASKQPTLALKIIQTTESEVLNGIQDGGDGDDVRQKKVMSSNDYILMQALKAEAFLLQNQVSFKLLFSSIFYTPYSFLFIGRCWLRTTFSRFRAQVSLQTRTNTWWPWPGRFHAAFTVKISRSTPIVLENRLNLSPHYRKFIWGTVH